ncbi:MAG: fumarylacetoacetate hydrolase family protein [Bacteroidales bacterium]|nr:fumarylacetoacetate hydrolase family protein [Bacteroidales bacterium]
MKIVCIGRNYADHARELGNEPPAEPVFFMKPDTALLRNNQPFFMPDFSQELHHEVEVVLRICRLGRHIEPRFAHRYYDAITVGIDFTARDLQRQCAQQGLPWEKAKAFDGSAPIGDFVELAGSEFDIAAGIDFRLDLNGTTVQQGNTRDMLFGFDELIAHTSRYITYRTGDLLFTGTPVGVGPVRIGDRLKAYLGERLMLDFFVK